MTTKFVDRFIEVLTLLTGGKNPDSAVVEAWLDHSSDALQSWCIDNGSSWMQGIEMIDAAMRLADNPEEDAGHEYRDPAAVPQEDPLSPQQVLIQLRGAEPRTLASYDEDVALICTPDQGWHFVKKRRIEIDTGYGAERNPERPIRVAINGHEVINTLRGIRTRFNPGVGDDLTALQIATVRALDQQQQKEDQ